jgi:hypothetical protein
MVAQQARFAFPLFLDCRWGKHEFLEVPYEEVRQHDPKFALDELRHFFSQEGGMVLGGFVATTVDAGILLVR